MRRSVKIVVWVAVLATCAVAGAVVAAHTDPFPPGVQDPGAQPSATSSSPTPPPATPVLSLHISATTSHDLHVGGTCTSAWTIRAKVKIRADGSATGAGLARLAGEAACPFATAQVQTRSVPVALEGHMEEGTLLAALHESGDRSPAGAGDLGGFLETLPRLRLTVSLGGGADVVTVTKPDGDLGSYDGRYRSTVTCMTGC